jgi:hypothetical protein
MKSKIVRVLFGGALACVLVLGATSVLAQASGGGAATTEAVDASGITGFFLSLAAKYPWLATVLLVIGGLRCLFKPVMSLLDNYIKSNCTPDEYAKLQSFEAGTIYKWLNFGLDFIGSVKLPVLGVKPPSNSEN